MLDSPLPSPRKPPHPQGSAVGESSTESVDGLWSSILISVSGSRSVATKNCIVLGRHKAGKSTLLSRIASRTGEPPLPRTEGSKAGVVTEALDLGLSYSVLDVGDEADEETLARLGVYQLPSPDPPYPALLPLALSKSTILDSLVVIVLDWDKPWRFLRDLKEWIVVLDQLIQAQGINGTSDIQQARERLEAHLRHYAEPVEGMSSSALLDADSELPPGTLTHNLGLQLVIVCTKADQIDVLEREKDYREDQFDYIQQALRTIALKYGAALFFTSHTRPESFTRLREYVLHRLFSPSVNLTAASSSAAPVSSASRAFPFKHRANVVDRNQLLVPTGWDSWGKIRILRDRFDASALSQAWDNDIEGMAAVGDVPQTSSSALHQYEDMIFDLESDNTHELASNDRIELRDDQAFLKAHYEVLQKDREKDPRAAFAARPGGAPSSSLPGMNGLDRTHASFGPSITGSVGNGSLGSATKMERNSSEDARAGHMARKLSSQGSRESVVSPLGGSVGTSLNPASSGTGVASAAGATASGGQNEVLANFFQSLLAARSTGTSAASSPVMGASNAASAPVNSRSPALNGRPSSRQEAAADGPAS